MKGFAVSSQVLETIDFRLLYNSIQDCTRETDSSPLVSLKSERESREATGDESARKMCIMQIHAFLYQTFVCQ